MTSQLAFNFEPPAEMNSHEAARARAAIGRYRSRMSDDDITGRETDVMGLQRRRTIDEPKRQVAAERPARQSRGLPPARFHRPRPPVGRPCTPDGRQAFHFKLTKVTKGVDGACRTNDGEAADPVGHIGYVTREDAVALAVPVEVHDAVAHVGYVARDEALAREGDGAAMIESNIPGDAGAFFATVLAHEDSGHPDGICLAERFDPQMLHVMMETPDIPPALKTALERIMADPEAHRVEKAGRTDGGSKSRTHPFQVDADIAGCAGWLKEHDPDRRVHLREGRGGIVQRRITGELSADLDLDGCRRVMKAMGSELARRDLRYYIALHAPTAANNERNWHFHLLYYDRPCERIDGQWDFAIVEEKRTASRNRRRSYPHRQKKCAEVRHKDWPMYMRTRFADAVNAELEAIGSPRRYDPRSYADMGIEAEPQQHLAPRLAFIAACGAAPEKDVENAHKGWWARMVAWLKRHDEIEKADEERVADLRRTSVEGPEDGAFLADLARELARRRAEARTADVILSILHPMARSNAEQTAEKMRGYADDLADKLRAKGKDPEGHPRYEALVQRERDAHAYLDDLEKAVAPDVAFAKSLADHAQIGRDQIEWGFQMMQKTAIWRREDAGIEHPMMPTPSKETGQRQTVEDTVPPLTVTAEPASAPAPSAKEEVAAKALASAEVDDWLARIRTRRRRITRRDGRTEPYKIDDLDRRMLDLASAEQVKELDLIRDRQNRLIGRMVEAVKAEPGILTIPADPSGKWTLAHRERDLQDGLRCYIADPDVQGRLRNARDEGLELQAATRQARPQVHRAIDEISRANIPVHRQDDSIVLRDTDAARLGVTPGALQSKDAQRRLEGIRQSQEKRTAPVARPPATEAPRPPIEPTTSPAPSPTPAVSTAPKTERPAAADMKDIAPVVPPVAAHPLVLSWREAHDANLRPGSAITVGERNRRAAVALADKVAAAELARLAPAMLAEATMQAAANRRYMQRAAGRTGPSPHIR
ncbi:MobA/MobL family protein [Sphingomonas adhaesiva]|uniref:MobA/MobL family protein n=1 Tax=Sphingomonas adhaesiva TaxID=28212 RepID=UPI002FFB7916